MTDDGATTVTLGHVSLARSVQATAGTVSATAVLSASTAYSKTISDPAIALEFSNKLSAIQDKMYAK